MAAPSPQQRLDLVLDLQVELEKLDRLVESLTVLGAVEGDGLRVDAAALRLQSLYTGIERCLLQISRVMNGGTPYGGGLAPAPAGADGPRHPRTPRRAQRRLRHLVRHLYAYELQPEPVERLRLLALALWPKAREELRGFQSWLGG